MRAATTRIVSGLLLAHVLAAGQAATASGQTPGPLACADYAAQKAWVENYLGDKPSGAFFSLLCGAKRADDILRDWQRTRTAGPPDAQRTRIAVAWRDPASNLAVRCEAVEYRDFPAVEWVLELKNEGQAATPILSEIEPLAASLLSDPAAPCTLHYAKGGLAGLDDFAPQQHAISTDRFELRSAGGRSSNGVLPFFNLDMDGCGMVGAIGWTGNWAARFERAADGRVTLTAGMQRTHLKLLPGESIRTPRILLLFWKRDRLESQNLLRRFLLAHHSPLPKGTERLPVFYGSWGELREKTQLDAIRWFVDNKIPVDVFWIDAGWYGDKPFQEGSTDANSEWWKYTGSWRPNKITYPRGLAPIGDALRRHHLGFLLWIESERVFRGTDLQRQHPDWLLGPQGDNFLVNLGNTAARQGITDIVASLIEEGRLTWYRQDFNTDPEGFWRAADSPDRVGMTEIRYIEGLYAFWDALRARYPGLMIDNCASGGRRLDLETTSRSVPLWRSDFQCGPNFNPAGMQGQTYGLSGWIPLSAAVARATDSYRFRSGLGAGVILNTGLEQPERLKTLVEEARQMQPYFFGDYYPLTPYSLADSDWLAMQWNRPEEGDGVVLAYRRPACAGDSLRLRLRGLDPAAQYEVRNLDEAAATQAAGKGLLDAGLPITLAGKPAAAVIRYRRLTDNNGTPSQSTTAPAASSETDVRWDSRRLAAIEDALRRREREWSDPNPYRIFPDSETLAELLRQQLSPGELHRLAASCATMPQRLFVEEAPRAAEPSRR
jgi:alpha-galactosidase